MDKKILCPLMGGECIKDGAIRPNHVDGKPELVACRFWIQVHGKDPQGGMINAWDCAFAWMPVLMIENSKVGRETGAAVETFRNVSDTNGKLISGAISQLVQMAAGLPPVLPPGGHLPPKPTTLSLGEDNANSR